VKIHLVQFHPEVYNKESNLVRILEYIDKGLAADANLIAFGEMALIGLDAEDVKVRELAEPIPGPSVNKIAEKLKGSHCYVIMGMPEATESYVYNSAPLIGPHGLVGVCRKLYLANLISTLDGKVHAEGVYIQPGQRISIFDTEFGKIGIQICVDLAHPEIAMAQALAGAWLIINPSAVSLIRTDSGKQPPALESRPYETTVCLCHVNIVGNQAGLKYHGGTSVYLGRQGLQKRASMGEDAFEEVLVYEIDSETVYSARRLSYSLKSIRPELIEQLLSVAREVQYGDN
jgi:predicted amidohydrolase